MMKGKKKELLYAIAALFGAVFFAIVYGIYILNPFYTDWLISGGDLTQHYLGWEFFRKSDWLFPIGLTNEPAYPVKSSVIFTDSIPIFAVIFKALTAGMEGRFQYFGLWGILCFMLQGYWSAKLLDRYFIGKWQVLLGSVFFIASPTVIFRMYYHTALAAQWMILIALYFCAVHKDEYRKIGRTCMQWGLLGVLIGGIHLYFAPMCGVLLGVYILYSFLEEKKMKLRYILPGIAFAVGLFGNVYLLGGFYGGMDVGGTNHLGLFGFNLNSFVNPIGYSRILPWLEVYQQGQYEGFSYLGGGILLLLIMAVAYAIWNWKQTAFYARKNWLRLLIVLAACTGLILFAASPEISINDRLIFTWPYSSTIMKYWSIFGSTGRIVWPVYYLLFLGALIGAVRLTDKLGNKRVLSYVILGIALVLQLYDISDKLVEKHADYAVVKGKEAVLEDEFWNSIKAQDYDRMVYVSHNIDNNKILTLADWALENDLIMTGFYFARFVDTRQAIEEELKKPQERVLYVFKTDDTIPYEDYHNYQDVLNFYEAEGYMVGSVEEIGK